MLDSAADVQRMARRLGNDRGSGGADGDFCRSDLQLLHFQIVEADCRALPPDKNSSAGRDSAIDWKREVPDASAGEAPGKCDEGSKASRTARIGSKAHRAESQLRIANHIGLEITDPVKTAIFGLMKNERPGRKTAATHLDGTVDPEAPARPVVADPLAPEDSAAPARRSDEQRIDDPRPAPARKVH
jgi:hypothetical protein